MQFLLDFQQLEPVGGPGIEHHHMKEVADVGQYRADTFRMWKLWREIDLCVMLTETSRFKCDTLKKFCEVIRVKGKRIPDDLWTAFSSCFLNDDVPEDKREERLRPHVAPSEEKMYLATEWALVCRMQRTIVLREAAHDGKIVCFCQAVDRVPTGITKSISEKLVNWANATTLGRMVGLLGIYPGMLARLTQNLCREMDLVNDTRVTILDIMVHEDEPEYDKENAAARGYIFLHYLPTIKVQVHGATYDTGHGIGIFILKPMTVSSSVRGLNDSGSHTTVHRTQLPIWPDPVGTSQNGQGKTKEYIIADILPTSKLDTKKSCDKYFREVYLMISRCTTLAGLIILNAPTTLREILQDGPPDHVAEEERRCAEIHNRTFEKAQNARKKIMDEAPHVGWTLHPSLSMGIPDDANSTIVFTQPSSSSETRRVACFYDMNASPNGRAHELRHRLFARGWTEGHSCLREAAQHSCECGYVAVEIVRKIQEIGRPLTFTEAYDTHQALFANNATRLRQMNTIIGNFEIDDDPDAVNSDNAVYSSEGSPNAHVLDIGQLGQLATATSSISDMPNLLESKNISIGPWDDVEKQLITWESDMTAPDNLNCIVNTANAAADGQTDYHFFVVHAYRRTSRTSHPMTSTSDPTSTSASCACLSTDCVCKGDCDMPCEPSVTIGHTEWATWCAATRCVRCRQYFIDLRDSSGEHDQHDNLEDEATITTAANETPTTCHCLDDACDCKGICNNYCDPLERVGVNHLALWCATTHCLRCRKHFIAMKSSSSSMECPPPTDSVTVGKRGTSSSAAYVRRRIVRQRRC